MHGTIAAGEKGEVFYASSPERDFVARGHETLGISFKTWWIWDRHRSKLCSGSHGAVGSEP